MASRDKRYFITEVYNGSDGYDFQKDFVEYLKNIILKGRWEAMSEHQLFLQGAKKAIEEIIEELYQEVDFEEEIVTIEREGKDVLVAAPFIQDIK